MTGVLPIGEDYYITGLLIDTNTVKDYELFTSFITKYDKYGERIWLKQFTSLEHIHLMWGDQFILDKDSSMLSIAQYNHGDAERDGAI